MERGHNEQSHAGIYGWLGLAAGVAAFDALAPETMSSAFNRGMQNPYSRYLVLGAWAITTAHLLQLIPHEPVELDPFMRIANCLRPCGDTDSLPE
jgi:hypothetical protein